MRKNSPRRDQIIKIIKSRLLKNVYKPREKLPSFSYLEQELAVSRGTLRQAIRCLKEDGFIKTVTRGGIYAAAYPPFSHRFALIFRHSPESNNWNCFYNNILAELNNFSRQEGIRLEVFFNVAPELNNNEYRKVVADIAGSRLGGLIFTEELFQYAQRYFIEVRPDIRYVYIFGKPENRQFPSVDVDNRQLWERGLDDLRNQGCHQIGIIDKLNGIDFLLGFRESLAADIRPCRIVAVPENRPEILANLTTLLLMSNPDGIFVGNDNLLPGVMEIIRSSGQNNGRQIKVNSHCNKPEHIPRYEGVKLIGFDTHAILSRCIHALTQPRVLVPDYEYIPAEFDQ